MQKPLSLACAFLFAASLSSFARSAMRIDINPALDRHDILTPNCHNWNIADGDSASATFDGIQFSIRKIGPAA